MYNRSGRDIKYGNILFNLLAIVNDNYLLDISAGFLTPQIFGLKHDS